MFKTLPFCYDDPVKFTICLRVVPVRIKADESVKKPSIIFRKDIF